MARTDREGRLSVFFHHVFKTRIGSRTVMALLFFVQEDVLPNMRAILGDILDKKAKRRAECFLSPEEAASFTSLSFVVFLQIMLVCG